MQNYSPIVTFNGAVRAAAAPSHNDDLVRKQDAAGLSYISSIAAGSSSYLSVVNGELTVESLLISDVHVDNSQTSLANFISNESSTAASLKKGDFLVLTAATGGAETYIVSGADGSASGNYTQVESGLTSAEIVAKLTGGTGINIAANGTISFDGDTDDVAEGSSNLYYTQARFDSALSAKSTSDLSEGSNLYYTDARFDTRLGAKSTSDLSEGTNLYYTDARSRAAVSAISNNALLYNSSNGQFRVSVNASGALVDNGSLAVKVDGSTIDINGSNQLEFIGDSDQVSEGSSNLYHTTARVRSSVSAGGDLAYNSGTGVFSVTTYKSADFNTDFGAKSTDNLGEGSSNLYHTTARARASVSAGGDLSYNSGTGVFSVTTYKSSNFNTDFSGKSTADLSESGNLYYTDARARAALSGSAGVAYNSGTGAISLDTAAIRAEFTSQSLTANVAKTLNHNLGSKFVHVSAFNSSDQKIEVDVQMTDANNCTITSVSGLSGVTVICSL